MGLDTIDICHESLGETGKRYFSSTLDPMTFKSKQHFVNALAFGFDLFLIITFYHHWSETFWYYLWWHCHCTLLDVLQWYCGSLTASYLYENSCITQDKCFVPVGCITIFPTADAHIIMKVTMTKIKPVINSVICCNSNKTYLRIKYCKRLATENKCV